MGYYLEPKVNNTLEKKNWCDKNGILLNIKSDKNKIIKTLNEDTNDTIICLIDNNHYQAIGLIYSIEEFDRFNDKTDKRTKYYYIIDKKLAYSLSNYNKK
jgi:hypothetical protein